MYGDRTAPTAGPAMQPTLAQQKQQKRTSQMSVFGEIGKAAKSGVSGIKKLTSKPEGGVNDMTNTGGMGGE